MIQRAISHFSNDNSFQCRFPLMSKKLRFFVKLCNCLRKGVNKTTTRMTWRYCWLFANNVALRYYLYASDDLCEYLIMNKSARVNKPRPLLNLKLSRPQGLIIDVKLTIKRPLKKNQPLLNLFENWSLVECITNLQ